MTYDLTQVRRDIMMNRAAARLGSYAFRHAREKDAEERRSLFFRLKAYTKLMSYLSGIDEAPSLTQSEAKLIMSQIEFDVCMIKDALQMWQTDKEYARLEKELAAYYALADELIEREYKE